MDASGSSSTAASATDTQRRITGGEVEPIRPRVREQEAVAPATPARVEPWMAPPAPAERFEVRDPTSELTYRAGSLGEARERASALGTTRMLAVDAEGRRTPLRQVDGVWQRSDPLLPQADRPAEAWAQERDADSPVRATELAGHTAPSLRRDAAADRAALAERIQVALAERYVVRRPVLAVGDVGLGKTEYRFRGDSSRVAFTASTFKLATQSDHPSVARSMVDLAQARGWKGLRISGSEDFRRMVWVEASVRGMRTQGYEPTAAELDLVRREHEARQTNRIEPERPTREAGPTPQPTGSDRGAQEGSRQGQRGRDELGGSTSAASPVTPASAPSAQKASGRGSGGGRKAVIAALEAVLVARGVTQARREAVMAAAEEQLAARSRQGVAAPRVKVYDAGAPSHRPAPTKAAPTPQRQRERTEPAIAQGR